MTPPLEPTLTSALAGTQTSTATTNPLLTPAALPTTLSLDPADWHNWPVLPIVTEHARQIYLLGQSLGNDPHAVSIFGDCQSEPAVFLGIYEADSQVFAGLPVGLQETVTWFSGSLNRPSPTSRGGATTGALLWMDWNAEYNQHHYGCLPNETPLQCELRIHKPSFVIIHVGSHYEDRNEGYMRTILDQLIAAGIVPILGSKADDLEGNEHVNAQYAALAVEYNIPFWNFWATLADLPDRGLIPAPADGRFPGGLYLTDEAAAIQRLSALQALDVVRRAVAGP